MHFPKFPQNRDLGGISIFPWGQRLRYAFFYTAPLHRACANSRCMSYDKNDEACSSPAAPAPVSSPSGAVQYRTAFMNWSLALTRVLTRMIFGWGTAGTTAGTFTKAAVFLSLGVLHSLQEYFHRLCLHMRFGLQCMQALGFLPCSHPPVQATHLRLSLLCSHCKCGLHHLQFDIRLRPWAQSLVFVPSIAR